MSAVRHIHVAIKSENQATELPHHDSPPNFPQCLGSGDQSTRITARFHGNDLVGLVLYIARGFSVSLNPSFPLVGASHGNLHFPTTAGVQSELVGKLLL